MLEQLKSDYALWSQIKNDWNGKKPDTELKLRVGPVASGSAVLNDNDRLKEILEQHRKVIGVEMEAYGVYAAAYYSRNPRPIAIAMKSVCDYADGAKDDDYQQYAAYTSAQALRYFFERYMKHIDVEAG